MRPPHLPNLPSLAKALAQRAAHEGGFVAPWDRFHGPPEGLQIGGRPLPGGMRFVSYRPPLEFEAPRGVKAPLQSNKLKQALAGNKARTQRKGLGAGISGELRAGRNYKGRPRKGD